MPQREDRDQVLRRHNPVARPDQHLRQITPLELLLGAQDREVQLRHFDPRDLVASGGSAFCIGIGERVAEAYRGDRGGLGQLLADAASAIVRE